MDRRARHGSGSASMNTTRTKGPSIARVVVIVALWTIAATAAQGPGISGPPPSGQPAVVVRTASAGGVKLQYLTAGRGPAVVLLHGYAETSRMWRPLMARLADRFTVIAPDLPGIGGSDIPKDGLDLTHAAIRIHDLVKGLGIERAVVIGHDIGLMVAYAYAAQFPADTDKLVLMDAFLPGVDGWEAIYNNPSIWHFRFNGSTPEALVKGRERIYFEHFWNDFAADRTRSIPDADRLAYTAAYARPGRMRAAWAYFVSFPQAAKDFAQLAQTKLRMPVLAMGGEKANGDALGKQVKLVATNVETLVLPNTGHWVMEERPRETMEVLMRFLGAAPASTASSSTLGQIRLTPAEVRANQSGSDQIGSSGLAGVSTKVVFGDPSKKGFYTIVLSVPAHTTIQAHSHRDDRIAVVVSGTWHFGYGHHFDERSLKRLPPGSVYSEPGATTHFAQTDTEPVLVETSGFGPTDTRYFDRANTPKT